jgi:hypothetical protein
VGKRIFLKVRKSQIRELLGSFRYRKSAKSANCLCMELHKSQNFMINPQIHRFCGLAEVLNPQIIKRLDMQIESPQSATLAEGLQI